MEAPVVAAASCNADAPGTNRSPEFGGADAAASEAASGCAAPRTAEDSGNANL